MDKAGIDKWAKSFVADLQVGGEAIPLDRVLARHLDTLSELRAHGLTWNAVASIIARAGARRGNGRPISPDQLRANVARLRKRRPNGETSVLHTPDRTTSAAKRPESRKMPPASRPPALDEKAARRPAHLPAKRTSPHSKEISQDDIAAALSRIQAK